MLNNMIRTAEQIRDSLPVLARDLELAMERESLTRAAYVTAKRDYEDAEAEIAFELVHTADGRNAEARKAQVDIGLIRARADGALRTLWGRMLAAQADADAAKLACDQMARRFRATEAAADLTAAMLKAASR